MLSFDVRSLAVHAADVDGALELDDEIWLPGDVKPDSALHVSGRLSVAGSRRYYFSGRFAGTATVDCRRCLVPVAVAVADNVSAVFSDGLGEDSDDPDIYVLAEGGQRVDVRPAIREQWLLNVPAFAVCRADCRGICATCGADLNAGACSCAPVANRRWNALRATRSQAD
jgi:uncharacterized protein